MGIYDDIFYYDYATGDVIIGATKRIDIFTFDTNFYMLDDYLLGNENYLKQFSYHNKVIISRTSALNILMS
jgi:hypothetical protein